MDPFLGEIKMVGFNFAADGYAFCQAQLMPISQNSALFALLGTTFGGDGAETFGLPDYRGRTPIGMGNGPSLSPVQQGEIGGSENVSLLSSNMPAHAHTVAIPANTGDADAAAPSATCVLATDVDSQRGGTTFPFVYLSTGGGNTNLLPFNSGSIGGNMPMGISNPYLGTNFIIALNGVFPSRS